MRSGLEAGGHECEADHLYDIGFDPVFRMQDAAFGDEVRREYLETAYRLAKDF